MLEIYLLGAVCAFSYAMWDAFTDWPDETPLLAIVLWIAFYTALSFTLWAFIYVCNRRCGYNDLKFRR